VNSDNSVTIDARYRVLVILWFGIIMSVLMFLVVIVVVPTQVNKNPTLTLLLNGLGLVPVAASFLLKQVLLAQSAKQQRSDLVQTAYILSFALCEVAALLGLMDHFLTGSRYFYLGFMIAGFGLLLNFPRKRHLEDAESYPKT